MIHLDRRTLLKLLAAASARSLVGCAPAESIGEAGSRLGGGKTVVVLGGGLAGLCSAYELRKRGYNVVAILEAQYRPGGRVNTYRGFANNQYAELGATRIPDTHNYTLGYAAQFNLPLRQFLDGPSLYYVRGQRFVHNDGDAWPSVFSFKPSELTQGADSIIFNYENLAELGNPLAADWPTGTALSFNGMGYPQYLQAKGAEDDVILLNRAINGTEITRDGALFWLMTDVLDAAWNNTYAIAGGNDQLPYAFAGTLGNLVKYGSIVTGIHQDPGGVTVTYAGISGGGWEGGQTVSAELCVCAIPYSVLRAIPITPAVSAEKAYSIQNMAMMPVSRCYMQTQSRFWNQQGIGGLKVARTDTSIERLWDHTAVQDGPSGILQSYMMASNAEAFAALPSSQRVSSVENQVSAFFPEIKQQVTQTHVKIWQQDPWARGGWAYHPPGQTAALFPAAKRSEGRIHFCGEHTSPWGGWMQGALESANRVVNEIVNG